MDELDQQLQVAAAGGGDQAVQRHRDRGKLMVRERIGLLLDPDTAFLELSPLGGYFTDFTVGGGFVSGIGVIAGVECVIVGNDPTVQGGAFTPIGLKKLERALRIAEDNRLPYVQLIESGGADLARRTSDPDAEMRRSLSHFGETGTVFNSITNLSRRGIPTISVVLGSSTAGGAYLPGVSDYNIFVRDRSKVFLAGPPLVKMATGEESDDEELGGAKMHASVSGLADYLAVDEHDALRICRGVVGHLNWRKLGPEPSLSADEPEYPAEELLGLLAPDLRTPLDIRDVIARVVDGSRFEDFKPEFGPTLVCGWASIHGYPAGILGNNGVLVTAAAEKATQFIQLCDQINVPLIFLQNLTGFMVGREYERSGIIKEGSSFLNAMANTAVPKITLIAGASYGAGNYAMSGRGFDPRFVFLWPTAKVAVMGPKQIAGVMSLIRRSAAKRRGQSFDEAEDRRVREAVEDRQERESLAMYATGRIADDGIIDPRDTRTVLGLALSACHSNEVRGGAGYGVFRM